MIPTRQNKIIRSVIAETGVIPDNLQLLRDSYRFEVVDAPVLSESRNSPDQPVMKIKGLFQEGNIINSNGRRYDTKTVLAPAVQDIQEDVGRRAVQGEYDHPSDAKIHLDRISHLITNVWMDGNKVYGEAEVLHKLPLGAALRGLFEHRVQTGISSRGVGDMELTEDNHRGKFYRVCPGYTILTWDVVADPSVKNAVLQISESVQNAFTNPRTKKLFSRDLYQKALLEEINRFFNVSKGPTTVSMSGARKKK